MRQRGEVTAKGRSMLTEAWRQSMATEEQNLKSEDDIPEKPQSDRTRDAKYHLDW
jgi:hypothetical protein